MADWQDDDVVAEQYADASNLAARQVLHARFSASEQSFHEWLFDRLDLPADASVLSLGAGSGTFWAANADRVPGGWDVTVTDAAQGMVMDAMEALADEPHEFNFDVVDATDVPYPDDAFDAVTANHVLYHLDDADRERAFAEIRRVLEPGGVLLASTNGEDNLAELFDVAAEFGDVPDELGFSLQDGGDQLREHFASVERHRFDTGLRVTTHEPLVAYVLSLPGFDDGDAFALADAFRERMDDGELAVTKDVGAFVARAADE
ncbi:class I SAM-dependent methyltransferase [Halobacterium yunchengense]|uniref:class I SAM-dependent methyltransferase n=1 Tax=Halobacterium yunchengense TaxID=3108497 RepID=UPI003008302B